MSDSPRSGPRQSASGGWGGGKSGFKSSRPGTALSCMPSAIPAASASAQDTRDFPCFPYDDQAKCRIQEYVVGPRMRKSAPIYTLQKADSRYRDKSDFFVRMEILDVGKWYGRGSSKKIAESSAAISGLIDLGIDTLKQHSEQAAAETKKPAPVPPESVRQYHYDDQAKCRLQEYVVGRTMRLPAPKYVVHSIAGSQNDPLFIVKMDIQSRGTWYGSGSNKKHAECSAAVAALIDLRVDQPDQHARKIATASNAGSFREALPPPVAAEPIDFAVSQDNIGFQLLVKHGWKEGSGLGKKSEGLLMPVDPVVPPEGHAGIGVVSKRNLVTVEEKASKELEAVQSRNSFIEHCYNILWKEKCFSRVFCMELSLLGPDLPKIHKSKSTTASKVLEKDPRFQFCTNQRGVSCIYLASMEYAGFDPNHEPLDNGRSGDQPAIGYPSSVFDTRGSAGGGSALVSPHSDTTSASKPVHRWSDDFDDEPSEMWPALPPARSFPSASALESTDHKPASSQLPASQNGSSVPQVPATKDPKPASSAAGLSRTSAFAPPKFAYVGDEKNSFFQRDAPSVVVDSSKCEYGAAHGDEPDAILHQNGDSPRAGLGLYRPPQVRGDSLQSFNPDPPRDRAGLGIYRPQGRGRW